MPALPESKPVKQIPSPTPAQRPIAMNGGRSEIRNPLVFYRGVLNRLFLLYKHVIGLLMGGFVANVRALPEYKKRGVRYAGRRLTANLVRLLVKKDIRDLPFAEQLRTRLEILGPTYVKLGQVMAIREDILPENITSELTQLLDSLPPVDFGTLEAIIEQNFGRPVSSLFQSIESKPLGSASIGQTHRATTFEGDPVVLKVIKPGIRDTILSDLKLLQILGTLLEWIIPRYQPKVIIDEFCNYTEKETDLTFEADHAELFALNFADQKDVVFPKIYRELSSRDVLCMEFFDGSKPTDDEFTTYSAEDQQKIIDLGAYSLLKMLYEDGFFHADLHAGNLMILEGPKVGFIDLGMVGRFDEKLKLQMLYYFYAMVTGDIENAAKHLLAMARVGKGGDPTGFRRAVADLMRRFTLQAGSGNFSLAQMILTSLNIGGRHRIFFPVEMTLMVKALVTFEGVGQQLDPDINIPELSRKHVQRIFARHYNPEKLMGQFSKGFPQMVDVFARMPELIADTVRAWDRALNDDRNENPLAGVRSGLLAGSCIIGGVIALVQGGHWLLWLALFGLGFGLAIFGKSE